MLGISLRLTILKCLSDRAALNLKRRLSYHEVWGEVQSVLRMLPSLGC